MITYVEVKSGLLLTHLLPSRHLIFYIKFNGNSSKLYPGQYNCMVTPLKLK